MNRLQSWLAGAMVGVAVVATLAAPVAAARSLDEIMASKKLIVGINPTLPPLGVFNAKNEIDGVDVDIARAIAEKMGLSLEIVQVGSPDRIPFVNSGKIDMVMGAMTWTAERAKAIDYNVPVYTEVMGVLTTQKTGWKDWKELDDRRCGWSRSAGRRVRVHRREAAEGAGAAARQLPRCRAPDRADRADSMVDVLDFLTEHQDAQGGMERPSRRPWMSSAVSVSPRATKRCARDPASVVKGLNASGVIDKAWQKWFGAPMLRSRGEARSGKSWADAPGRGDVGPARSRRSSAVAQDLITAPRRT
jgi:polar amino acid transport system substrate-binding protein